MCTGKCLNCSFSTRNPSLTIASVPALLQVQSLKIKHISGGTTKKASRKDVRTGMVEFLNPGRHHHSF
jgi:hypothetical protein